GYTDCSNLERGQHNLGRDMAEVFITDRLRKYEFKVWPGEKFTPEEVVWNRMALDGYKLRWFNKITYLCEYQQGGLSDSTWSLLRNNPMGYAMMFDIRLEIYKDIRSRLTNAIQYGSCCFLAGERAMLAKSYKPWLTMLVSPLSWAVACRRRKQFGRLLK
ncbi:MAG: glycosyltransferase family 2 protein, partial [Muribaculaceae bacterium]|nr:glycosyltransferase family 2 protein [Muribaculaceae bacterium]